MALHRNIRIISLFNFFTDFRFFAPVAILYFQSITGSFALGTSVFSIVFISSALFEVPTGIFSDKIGRKNTVIAGTLCATIGVMFYAIGMSYWVLLIGAMFEGLGRSFYSGNNSALLHDTLAESKQEHQYHEFLGKTSSMFQFASALAAIIGGFIASISFALVMWISVIPQILCLILSFYLVEPKIHLQESTNVFDHLSTAVKKFRENKKLRLLSIAHMINFGMGDAGFEFQAAFYNLVWPTWALGIARTIANFAGAISFYISGKLINKYSAIKLLLAESIISPSIKIVSALVVTPFSPALMASMSLLYGVGNVSGNTLQQKEFSNEQRATMGSLISLGGSLFNALSAFVLGVIADKWGVVSAIIFAQIVLLSLNYFYLKIYRS